MILFSNFLFGVSLILNLCQIVLSKAERTNKTVLKKRSFEVGIDLLVSKEIFSEIVGIYRLELHNFTFEYIYMSLAE